MRMVNCPACGAANSARRESCYQCGAPLEGNVVAFGLPSSTPDARERDALIARTRAESGDADWQRLRQAQRRLRGQPAGSRHAVLIGAAATIAVWALVWWWWCMTVGPLLTLLWPKVLGTEPPPEPVASSTWWDLAAHLAPSLVLLAVVIIGIVLRRRYRSLVRAERIEPGQGSAGPQSPGRDLEAVATALSAAAEADGEAVRPRAAPRLPLWQPLIIGAAMLLGLTAWMALPDDTGSILIAVLRAAGIIAVVAGFLTTHFILWPLRRSRR